MERCSMIHAVDLTEIRHAAKFSVEENWRRVQEESEAFCCSSSVIQSSQERGSEENLESLVSTEVRDWVFWVWRRAEVEGVALVLGGCWCCVWSWGLGVWRGSRVGLGEACCGCGRGYKRSVGKKLYCWRPAIETTVCIESREWAVTENEREKLEYLCFLEQFVGWIWNL